MATYRAVLNAKFIRKAIEVIESNLSNSKFSVEEFSDRNDDATFFALKSLVL